MWVVLYCHESCMNYNIHYSTDTDCIAAASIKTNNGSSTNMHPMSANEVFHSGRFTMVGSALDHDVVELKKLLGISYEMALKWVQHRADSWDIKECRKSLADRLAAGGNRKAMSILRALAERYSLVA